MRFRMIWNICCSYRGGGDTGDVEYVADDEADGLDAQERAEMWFTTVSDCLCLLKKMPESMEVSSFHLTLVTIYVHVLCQKK